jgi:hypothetical protein
MKEKEIIYGVCDKTGTCDSYFGFFKKEKDAIKELHIQVSRMKEDLGMIDIIIENNQAVFKNKKVITIHSFVLR